MKKRVIGINELSVCLDTSVAAIRAHLQRDTGAAPKPFKLGRRLAWTTDMVEDFLKKKELEALEMSLESEQTMCACSVVEGGENE